MSEQKCEHKGCEWNNKLKGCTKHLDDYYNCFVHKLSEWNKALRESRKKYIDEYVKEQRKRQELEMKYNNEVMGYMNLIDDIAKLEGINIGEPEWWDQSEEKKIKMLKEKIEE